MSEENVEIVRRVWEMWERGALTRWHELLSDDLVTRRRPGLDYTTYHGKAGFLDQTSEWSAPRIIPRWGWVKPPA